MAKAKIHYAVKVTDGPVPDHVLTKRGHDVEFTLRDVGSHRLQLGRLRKECVANAGVQMNRAAELMLAHPEIAQIPEEVAKAAAEHFAAMERSIQYDKKIAEIDEVLADYDRELVDIAAALGAEYDITAVSAHGEAADDAEKAD